MALGGTATVDGGEGMREVMRSLPVPCVALADVRTRLGDAARLYGPQKGATPGAVGVLEARLAAMDELRPYAETQGSGAAGRSRRGVPRAGAALEPGAPTVLDLAGLDARFERCDVVVTGEGAVDATTLEGKAPGEVARRAVAAGVRCVVFGGRVDVDVPGAEMFVLSGDPTQADRDLVELGRAVVARSELR